MRAVVIEAFGGVETLQIKRVPDPLPQDHEILIRIAYAGVNPVDWKIREGRLSDRLPHQFPLIPGWDAAGTVTAVGSRVTAFAPGDQVFSYCRKPLVQAGTYAEYVCCDASHAALKPTNLSFAQAAAVPLAALTAWQALFDFAQVKKGQKVVILAGAGAVSSFAIQFAKHAGALICTTCPAAKQPYVRSLGADITIDYAPRPLTTPIQAIKAWAPKGVDLVLDTVGGPQLKDYLSLIHPTGTLVSIVKMITPEYGEKDNIKTGFLFVRPNGAQLTQIAHLIETQEIRAPHVIEMALEQAALAQTQSQEGHPQGKLVLRV